MDAKIALFLCFASSILHFTAAAFTPRDNYLLNCGSDAATVVVDARTFVGDASPPQPPPYNGSAILSRGKSISLSDPNPASSSNVLYHSARLFTADSSYVFGIANFGTTHFLRLHFSPFTSGNYNLKEGNFRVSANGLTLLNSFRTNSTVIEEFFLMVDRSELEISFTPATDSTFGYINAIEVFSAPKDFFVDSDNLPLITPKGNQEFEQNVSSLVLRTVHRINVGGSKVTPFNDTLWRTWIPDEEFLVLKSAAKVARTMNPPRYQPGGATRENAPESVYMTAQQMNIANNSLNNLFNVTWDFPVNGRSIAHLIRLHFCDIVSSALDMLYFNVYVNEVTACKDFDLSALTFQQLASPFYVDFMVEKAEDSGDSVRISVGPSELSTTWRRNAILNGVEIMEVMGVRSVIPASAEKSTKLRKNWLIWLLVICIAIFALGSVAFSVAFFVFKRRRRRSKKSKPRQKRAQSSGWASLRALNGSSIATSNKTVLLHSPGPYGYYDLKIPFEDLKLATNDFDKSLIVGSGGFGTVYKGILGQDQVKVAVKRGVPGSRQGLPEFHNEITVLSKIRHRHLVPLVGYCDEEGEMILVYEYMEKGTLRAHLYKTGGGGGPSLPWKRRLEVCIGAARGLHYLHTGSAQGMIIHRDIKSTNILLDENFVAKVADFGLSKPGPCPNETHVSTGVKGSFGYLDPEYFRRQQLTDKSDVYSFGVVLLEVLCGRPAIDPLLEREQVNLAEWAMERVKNGSIREIVDPIIGGEIREGVLEKFGQTAEKCLEDYGVDRPSMGDVLWNLEQAYQIQVNGGEVEEEDGGSHGGGGRRVVGITEVPLVGRGDDACSDISTSGVFSQLITSEGR